MNPCGPQSWRPLEDGRTELFGELPVWEPGSTAEKDLLRSWANFEPEILAAAEEYGVPIPWIAGILTAETGLWSGDREAQRTIVSPAGAAGPMQIMPATATYLGWRPEDRYDPAANFAMGAKLLGMHLDKGLPGAAAVYNTGGLRCCPGRNALDVCMASYAGKSYAEHAVRHANTAADLELGQRRSAALGFGLAFAGVGLAWLAWRNRAA